MAAERVVIDSGFLLESILPTKREWKHQADRLLEGMVGGEIQGVVPWLFFFELASVCARKTRARSLDANTAELFFETIEQCGFHLELAISTPSELFAQAMRLGCQVGDSVYIEVARQADLPLATVDGRRWYAHGCPIGEALALAEVGQATPDRMPSCEDARACHRRGMGLRPHEAFGGVHPTNQAPPRSEITPHRGPVVAPHCRRRGQLALRANAIRRVLNRQHREFAFVYRRASA